MSIMTTQVRNPFLRAESLEELCAWHGADFVRCAYVTILGRQPDPDGESYYLRRFYRGVSKLTLISQMRRSSEGRRHDPGIAGLDRKLRQHRNACRPIVGPVIRLFTGRSGDSFRERQSRLLAEIMDSLDSMRQQQGINDVRLHDLERGLTDRMGKLGSDMTALSGYMSHQQNDRDAKLRDLESAVTDRMKRLEAATTETTDTHRELAGMAVDLSSKVEQLASSLRATDGRIEEVRANSERVRGLLLKASQQARG